jgi:putative hydrolase
MIEYDFHSHSLFSSCGVHTVIEMLLAAKSKGVKALAITDHGKFNGGKANNVFYERLENPVSGIRLLKGVEANPDVDGNTDIPKQMLHFLDIVLLGLHDNIPRNKGADFYTSLLVKTMELNPYIDIITHPNNSAAFPLDYRRLCEAAISMGVVLELNNSKVRYSRNDYNDTILYIKTCAEMECPVAICSDAHCVGEIGDDFYMRKMLQELSFPERLVVNSTEKSSLDFLNQRKRLRNG